MRLAVGSNLNAAVNHLLESGELLLLVEIERAAGGFFRLVRNNRNIQAGGHAWVAASIDIEFPAEDAEGTLGQVRLGVSNISRAPLVEVEINGELLGRAVTLIFAHKDGLSTLAESVRWRHIITAVTANERVLVATCQHAAEGVLVPLGTIGPEDFPALGALG